MEEVNIRWRQSIFDGGCYEIKFDNIGCRR